MRFLWLLFFLTPSALAQAPEVRIWVPYGRDTFLRSCLAADLADWESTTFSATGEIPVPHRFVNLPDGKYADQVWAALKTGEQPDLLMIDVSAFGQTLQLGEGIIFGADLIGLWVHQRKIAELPQASARFAELWLGDTTLSLAVLDDFMLLLGQVGEVPLGIDAGPQGTDLGLALALMIEQWTDAFGQTDGDEGGDAPNWDSPGFADVLSVLKRWQQDGLMIETSFSNLQAHGQPLPILTMARYSEGKDLGDEWAFYPLFSNVEGKAAAFLELPLTWFSLRPDTSVFSEQIIDDIKEGTVFETCAETAGLISYAQIENFDQTPILEVFANRQGQILPSTLPIDIAEWTGLQPDLPTHLANTIRDMRAGLETSAALRALKSFYAVKGEKP